MNVRILLTFYFLFFTLCLKAQVTADFSANVTSGCSPLVVIFSDLSTGNPTSWNWNLGNGNNSNLQNPGATYVNPGTYTVTLAIANGGFNDTETKTAYITVFANPVANFSGTPTSGCLPLVVNFSDQSTPGTGAINQWFWDFGDGLNSAQQNPAHIYTSPGNYTVSLIVTDVNGCTKSITQTNFINTFNGPSAGFTASSTSSCTVPFLVNFTNTSTGSGGLTYQWTFSGGTPASSSNQDPSVTYNAAGSYNVTLVVTDGGGCKDTLTQNNLINIIEAGFSGLPLNGCAPLTVNFSNSSLGNPTVFQWDFGDAGTGTQSNPSHTYSTPGTYTVTLTAGNGTCDDTEIKTNYITVGTMPVVDFTASDTVPCQIPSIISFTDNTSGSVAWEWDFGDGGTSTLQNPTHTYSAEGNYNVSLIVTVSNGCKDTLVKISYVVLQKPNANFTADTNKGCIPLTVQFSDASTSGSPIVSWNWSFGDGNSSISQNPSNTYNDTGQYIVKLFITNDKGCVDSAAILVYAGLKPVAGFSATPLSGCRPLTVDFTDLSSSYANMWFWIFGDGQTDTTQNPTHIYNDTGAFDVTLVVSNNGCRDTLSFTDYVIVYPPKAIFSVLPGTIGCNVPFTVTLQDQSQGADTWFWDFGDGNTFSGQNPPPFTYDSGGQFIIKLVVTNSTYGCSDSTFQTIRISEPIAAFTVSGTGCQPLLATFTDASSSPFGVRNWQWDFGDGYTLDNMAGQTGTSAVPNGTNNFLTSGTYQNPTHTYMDSGTYTVTLTITDQLVCTHTVTMTNVITVYQIPTVNITSDKQAGCPPFTVQFTDLSAGPVGMEQWSWNFGDGGTDTVQNPEYTYTAGGIFTVTLIATDSNGCISGIVKNNYITVVSPLAGFFSNTGSCIGVSQLFTDTSTASNPIVSWFWDFGDGATDTLQNPMHTYGTSGVFDVALAIADSAGCVDTLIRTNYITVQSVTAAFGANPTNKNCPPLLVQFSDSSSAGIVSWYWQFGNGNTSALQNPSHLYNAPGKYDVTLIVTTSLGCKDTLIKPELIKIDGPNGDLIFIPDSGCPGTIVSFDTINVENAVSYAWDFGDGNIVSSSPPITHQYLQVGIYHPFLTFQDANGCSFGVQSPDSIQIVNIPVDAGPDITICEGDSGMLQASGGITYNWSPATGLSNTAVSNPMASPADTLKYYVLVTDADGCQNNDSVFVFVNHNVPTANFNSSSVCMNDITDFTDISTITSDTIVSWSWNFNNGEAQSADTNPTYLFSASGNFNVMLTVTANNGCIDSVTKQVIVYPLPGANAGNDAAICIGESTQLQASGGISYAWMTDGTLSDTTIASPLAMPSASNTYFVIVTDANNCVDTDSVEVIVNPLPNADAGINIQICIGDSAQLNASEGLMYAWNADNTLSDTSVANPYAAPTDTTEYFVSVTDSNDCVNIDSVTIIVNPNYPLADFSAATVCENDSTFFNDLSSMIGDTIVSWQWDFNDGGAVSTDTNPAFVFSAAGDYNVSLIITANTGCRDSVVKTVAVNSLPLADAGPDDTVCIFQNTQLTATGGNVYLWNADSTLSDTSVANPFASPQVSTIYVVFVTDTNNCINSDTVSVVVNPLPIADAGPDTQICLGDSIVLNASAGVGYSWDSDVSLSATDTANPTATPVDTTQYFVTVTDSNGCANSDSVIIIVNPDFPEADFSATTVCEEQVTVFSDLSTITGDTIVAWEWDFGDPANDTLQNPSYTYGGDGAYLVTLVISTNKNCRDTVTDTVYVNAKPEADFIVADNCFGTTTIFKDTTQIGQGIVTEWLWDFGDNTGNLTIPNPPHNYSATGTFDVTLTVQSDSGCSDTVIKPVQVFPKPYPEFTASIACLNQATQFTDSSSADTSVSITSWEWTFGDASTPSAESDPAHIYGAAGTYTVKLVVATGGTASCEDSISHQIIVNPLPEPVCEADPPETNTRAPEVQFSTGTAVSYLWDFAGLDTSGKNNPVFSFPDSGTYIVILSVTNQFGCSDTCQAEVRIDPYYDIEVPNAFTPDPNGPNGGDYSINPYNNNVFFPVTRYVVEYRLMIFSRWGELLFVSEDLETGWDGYYKGKLCQQDVYVWKIKATFADGNEVTKAGDVTLIR